MRTLITIVVAASVSALACDEPGGQSSYVAADTPASGLDTGDAPDSDQGDGSANPPADATVATTTATGNDATGPAEVSASGSPLILSLDANTLQLDAGATLVVTAVVTDPDGIDDLIGGSLYDKASGGSYGAFATSAAEGAYTLQIAWSALNAVRPIDAPPAGVALGLRAEFFDVAGHKTTKELSVTLRCNSQNTLSLCAGECADLQTDIHHCGRCDRALPDGLECVRGEPGCRFSSMEICDGECVNLGYPERCGDCDDDCRRFQTAGSHLQEPTCTPEEVCVLFTTYEVLPELISGTTCDTLCAAEGLVCYEGDDGWGGRLNVATEVTDLVYIRCDEPYIAPAEVYWGECRCSPR